MSQKEVEDVRVEPDAFVYADEDKVGPVIQAVQACFGDYFVTAARGRSGFLEIRVPAHDGQPIPLLVGRFVPDDGELVLPPVVVKG